MNSLANFIKPILEPPAEKVCGQFQPQSRTHSSNSFFKRSMDIFGAVLGILVTLPLWGMAALLIKLEDGGPVFFYQVRVGKDARTFHIIKFRTMILDAEMYKKDLLPQSDIKGAFKMKKDPRVTRIGRFLRKYKLDELPQLLNVITGNMSLVGPRPTSLEEVQRAYDENTFKKFISGLKPGLTGWTQVTESMYGKVDLDEQLKYDLKYIRKQGILLDLAILLATIPAILLGRGH